MIVRSLVAISAAASLLIAGPLACKTKDKGEGSGKADKAEKAEKGAKGAGRPGPDRNADGTVDPIGDAHDPSMQGGEKAALSAPEYEKMMLALTGCKLEGIRIANSCDAARALVDRRRESRLDPAVGELVAKHIAHPAEPVRTHAAILIRSFAGAPQIEAAVAAAASEKSPAVLAQIVHSTAGKLASNPKVAALFRQLADHPSPLVRREVAAAYLAPQADAVAGTLGKAIEIAERDPDPQTRALVCKDLGRRGDERVLPALAALTADSVAKDAPAVYAACWEGLVQLFVSRPSFDKSSEKALDQFIAAIGKVECSATTPPWQMLNAVSEITHANLVEIAPWIPARVPALHDALSRIVLCKEASRLARSAAISALSKTGAPAKTLTKLAASLKKAKADEHAAGLARELALRAKP